MQEPEAVQLFHLSSFHVDRLMCLHLPFPKIYQLLGFADVEQQLVLCAAACQMFGFALHMKSPGCL